MAAILEPVATRQDALPACLWKENPYRLVSLWEIMLFDAGRLAGHVLQLTSIAGVRRDANLEHSNWNAIVAGERAYMEKWIRHSHSYCNEVGFSMAAIPIGRVVDRLGDADLTCREVGDNLSNTIERLRDEAATMKLLRIQPDRVKYYEHAEPFGSEVASNFPSVSFDITEACRSLALYRSTACVFHLMQVLEIGLRSLADYFGVPWDRQNWHRIIEATEKAIRNMGDDPNRAPDWRDQQEFFSQTASHFMAFKNAWRNYTAHARGKFTEDEAETILINVRSFMQKIATRLHE